MRAVLATHNQPYLAAIVLLSLFLMLGAYLIGAFLLLPIAALLRHTAPATAG